MRASSSLVATVMLLATPLAAHAQFGGGMGGGRGGMGGGMGGMGGRRGGGGMRPGNRGGANNEQMARAARDSMISRVGYARFILMNSTQLALADSQTVALTAIDAKFHQATDTLRERVDTLRARNNVIVRRLMSTRDGGDTLTVAERDSVIARRSVMAPMIAALQTAQQATRTEATAVLSTDQKTALEKILADPPRGAFGQRGGMGGRGGGMGGPPPEPPPSS